MTHLAISAQCRIIACHMSWEYINEPDHLLVGWAFVQGCWSWGACLTWHLEEALPGHVMWTCTQWTWRIDIGWKSSIIACVEETRSSELSTYRAQGWVVEQILIPALKLPRWRIHMAMAMHSSGSTDGDLPVVAAAGVAADLESHGSLSMISDGTIYDGGAQAMKGGAPSACDDCSSVAQPDPDMPGLAPIDSLEKYGLDWYPSMELTQPAACHPGRTASTLRSVPSDDVYASHAACPAVQNHQLSLVKTGQPQEQAVIVSTAMSLYKQTVREILGYTPPPEVQDDALEKELLDKWE